MKKPAVFGKYLLLERLNVGGMAEVFVAKAFGVEGFERILAIKKILPTMAEDEEFIKMFIDEARISVQLNHANIVHIHELGNYDGSYFIAMEYVAGRDLRTILERFRKRKERMAPAQASFIASKMCEGLDYAHRKKDARGGALGIIHRDVSPQNILCSFDGDVKIIDFGIAKAANRSQHTQAGILKGKFGYMSPEQVRGMPIDRRSDIFALGVILYEMLTGEKLFVGESDFSTLEKVRNAEVAPPRSLNPEIPEELDRVVLKSLAREPDDRYQWASDLQEDLMRFLVSGEAIFSSKQLYTYMHEVFADDLVREAEKMERFASVKRPVQIETSGIIAAPAPAPAKRPAPKDSVLPTVPVTRKSPNAPAARSLSRDGLDDVPLMASAEVQMVKSTPGYVTRTEMTPLPDIDEDGSEPKTAIDPGLFASGAENVVSEVSTDSHGKPPAELGDEPPTATTNASGDLVIPSAEVSTSGVSGEPTRRGGKGGPVIIGDANGYRGATHVGPTPVPGQNGAASDPGPEQNSAPEMGSIDSSLKSFPSDAGPTSLPSMDPAMAHKRLPDRKVKAPIPVRRARSRLQLVLFLILVVIIGGMGGYILRRASRTDATVVIEVEPEGVAATIRIDGLAIPGGDPWATEPGEHRISVEATGYRSYLKDHVVEHDTFVKVTLEPEATDGSGTATPPDGTSGSGTESPGNGEKPATAQSDKPSAEAAAKFAVAFNATPQGAEIRVDGKVIGKGPNARAEGLAIDQPHKYEVALPGYKTVQGEIAPPAAGGTEQKIPVKLEKEAPPTKDRSRDRERDKERERERRDRDREAREAREAKEREAREAKERERKEKEKEKAKVVAAAAVSKAKGKLACSASEPDAEIWIDGKKQAQITPVPIAKAIELGVGPHTVVFKLNGKQSDPQKIDIVENDVTMLRNVELK